MAEFPIINNQVMAEISIIKPNLFSSYPIKRLTYSGMQSLCDQGLCLNCNDIDSPSHPCPIKRIVLILPDEDPNIEQQSMEIHAPTVPKQFNSQNNSLHTLDHASDLPNSAASMKSSVHYQSDAYYSAAALFEALGITQALNYSWHTAQKENGAHHVFFEMSKQELEWAKAPSVFAEMNKSRCERKILIFDPGGGIFNAKCFFAIWSNHAGYLNINGHGNKMLNKFDKCISDLEDKVNL